MTNQELESKVDNVLTNTPKTMEEMMKEIGIDTTFYIYLDKLVRSGVLKRTKKGDNVAWHRIEKGGK